MAITEGLAVIGDIGLFDGTDTVKFAVADKVETALISNPSGIPSFGASIQVDSHTDGNILKIDTDGADSFQLRAWQTTQGEGTIFRIFGVDGTGAGFINSASVYTYPIDKVFRTAEILISGTSIQFVVGGVSVISGTIPASIPRSNDIRLIIGDNVSGQVETMYLGSTTYSTDGLYGGSDIPSTPPGFNATIGASTWWKKEVSEAYDIAPNFQADIGTQTGDLEGVYTDGHPYFPTSDPTWTHDRNGFVFTITPNPAWGEYAVCRPSSSYKISGAISGGSKIVGATDYATNYGFNSPPSIIENPEGSISFGRTSTSAGREWLRLHKHNDTLAGNLWEGGEWYLLELEYNYKHSTSQSHYLYLHDTLSGPKGLISISQFEVGTNLAQNNIYIKVGTTGTPVYLSKVYSDEEEASISLDISVNSVIGNNANITATISDGTETVSSTGDVDLTGCYLFYTSDNLGTDTTHYYNLTKFYVVGSGMPYMCNSVPIVPATFDGVETTLSEIDFDYATVSDMVYDSTAMGAFPTNVTAENYSNGLFTYSQYDITATGRNETFVNDNEYSYGIGGLSRINYAGLGYNAIGGFYFIDRAKSPGRVDIINGSQCLPQAPTPVTFWDFISTFWGYLEDTDRNTWEQFWSGINDAGFNMTNQADSHVDAINPVDAQTCLYEYNYDLKVGPLYSIPISVDPTSSNGRFNMRPVGVNLINPTVDAEGNVYRRDMIEMSARDYYDIRNISIGNYVVLQRDEDGSEPVSFNIINMMSSEEPRDKEERGDIDDGVNAVLGATSNIAQSLPDFRFMMSRVSEVGVESFSVTWVTAAVDGYDGVIIEVDGATPDIGNLISQLNADGSNPGITFYNRTPEDRMTVTPPSLGITGDLSFPDNALKFKELEHYIPYEVGNGRYYNPKANIFKCYGGLEECSSAGGEHVPDGSSFQYFMQVEGDLTGYEEESFNIYVTTGLAYNVRETVLDVPSLRSSITDDTKTFIKWSDYTLYDGVIEFKYNIFDNDRLLFGSTLYCDHAPIINEDLFNHHSGTTGIRGWKDYNYDNVTAKAAISALLQSLQNAGNMVEYQRALNIYYGMPIAPEDSLVLGLYESYGYEVTGLSGLSFSLSINSGVDLHKFIQPGSTMISSTGVEVDIVSVDRVNAVITVVDDNGVLPGDKLYLNLENKYFINSFIAETDDAPASIVINTNVEYGNIQHLVDMYVKKYDGEKYPEVVVYNSEEGNNGVYHITSAEFYAQGQVKLNLYKYIGGKALYNDSMPYDGSTDTSLAHIPWPTHKFLYLYMKDSDKNHVAYLDSPVDSWLDNGDEVSKYDRITRNVSVLNNKSFPGWNEYAHFKMSSGINAEADILELTSIISGAEFGEYFPADIDDNNYIIN